MGGGTVILEAPPATAIRFADDGRIPNSALPLLHYPAALSGAAVSPEGFEALFEANGWPPRWRASIFTYHHFHSTAHEVLGIAAGDAWVLMGGASGRELHVRAGDVVVIPAGVGHCRLSASAGFVAVGAYPPGADWDLMRGRAEEHAEALANIARVPLPVSDPVFGVDGPLHGAWSRFQTQSRY